MCHLDTLKDAFGLRVPMKYTIEWRIMADEHHVVAMSKLDGEASRQWCMSIFDLATCSENSRSARGGKTARKFFLAERHVRFAIESLYKPCVFLLDGWLVVALNKELVWFDKNGKRSETITELDTNKMRSIYSSRSSLLFTQRDGQLLLKRWRGDE